MPLTPEILIGNSNTYQVDDFRDAIDDTVEAGAEMYLSICENASSTEHLITAATNATPIVITSAAHGLTTGNVVTIVNVGGNGAAKGTWTITRVDADRFSLDTSVGDGAYTAGGQWFRCVASASGLELDDLGEGLYSTDVSGDIGLIAGQTYVLIFYCLGAYRDIFNRVVRAIARIAGS